MFGYGGYLDGYFDAVLHYFFLGHFMVANGCFPDYSQHSRFRSCICLFKSYINSNQNLSLSTRVITPSTPFSTAFLMERFCSIRVISLRFFVGFLLFGFFSSFLFCYYKGNYFSPLSVL